MHDLLNWIVPLSYRFDHYLLKRVMNVRVDSAFFPLFFSSCGSSFHIFASCSLIYFDAKKSCSATAVSSQSLGPVCKFATPWQWIDPLWTACSYRYHFQDTRSDLFRQNFTNRSVCSVKNQSMRCGLSITCLCLNFGVISLQCSLLRRLWNSGQCTLHKTRWKKIVGGPTWAMVALKSSFALCQWLLLPVTFLA